MATRGVAGRSLKKALGLGISLAALGALLVPATASATVTCSLAGNVLTITATGTDFDTPSIQRNGTTIEVRAVPGPTTLACAGGTPTVTTTDTINFLESGGGASQFSISVFGGTYAPGATNETGGSDEIEFNVTTDGVGDTLIINGDANVQNYRFGQNVGGDLLGNLNGDEADGLDSDVTATGIDSLFVNALGASADTFTANGGTAVPGSTAAASVEAQVQGGSGNDVLTGGSDPDTNLNGEDDNDILTAGANGATLRPGPGDDTVSGGASADDVISYLNLPGGATVNLGVATPQNTGGEGTETITGVESFAGSNGDDTVTGTSGPNILIGGPGNDTLDGGPGNDMFSGGNGTDTITYAHASGGVVFSLATALGAPQSTGGAGSDILIDSTEVGGTAHLIENLIGSPFADALTGDAAGNEIEGGLGADALSSLGGVDALLARDGIGDTALDCGGDAGDSAEVDALPLDASVTGCEMLDRPASTGTGPGTITPPASTATGQRAAALRKCKKKKSAKARKKCRRRARKLPV
jgi:Ca2+-binding RTX toxin-like protein